MKPQIALVATFLAIASVSALSQTADVRWGADARFHAGHRDLQDVPYDGDWSYGLVYEYREPQAYFQFLMSYAPKVSFDGDFDGRSGDIESIWTPELNLVFTSGSWGGGVGILKHHVRRADGGTWSPIFWQLLLALNLGNRGGLSLDIAAIYEYEKWGNLNEIDMRDLDVRIGLTRAF